MKRAFTLIECLVVVALVATLAAMLFPVFVQAKRPVKGTVCLSNLRQIGMAMTLYGNDADGLYPSATDPVDANTRCSHRTRSTLPQLHVLLQPYAKSRDLWRCPLDTGVPSVGNAAVEATECDLPGVASIFGLYGSSYIYRTDLAPAGVAQPASLFEPYDRHTEHGSSEIPVVYDAYGAWHGDPPAAGRKYNALMADGHVATRSLPQIALAETWIPR